MSCHKTRVKRMESLTSDQRAELIKIFLQGSGVYRNVRKDILNALIALDYVRYNAETHHVDLTHEGVRAAQVVIIHASMETSNGRKA